MDSSHTSHWKRSPMEWPGFQQLLAWQRQKDVSLTVPSPEGVSFGIQIQMVSWTCSSIYSQWAQLSTYLVYTWLIAKDLLAQKASTALVLQHLIYAQLSMPPGGRWWEGAVGRMMGQDCLFWAGSLSWISSHWPGPAAVWPHSHTGLKCTPSAGQNLAQICSMERSPYQDSVNFQNAMHSLCLRKVICYMKNIFIV